ncbi:saccharopine dehydrogenase-like oxidoreductase [Anabrus simplex]|uniref:saccharopine dehydrogenase-like oxidoreductase n=1 Tax=Anabrus simplex TaxID=316456 RepID=UPI0035A272D7
MAAVEEPKLDIVIFGATGFTGKCAVQEIIKLAKEKSDLSWGVAGRNESKLKEVLADISKKTGEDLGKIPIIIADVSQEDSLLKMAKQARVIVNCAGPYRFYGEPVVKACIAAGAHHVDVSGEPQYMEKMQLEYHKSAEEKGVYIVSACGFDSIPADMGTVFLINKFEGDVNSVETYLESWAEGSVKGAGIHYGTWASAVYGLAHQNELRPLRQKLFPERLPELKPKLKPRGLIHKNEYVEGWCLPFPGSDRSVIQRSQRYFYEKEKQRPAQIQAYVAFKSFLAIIAISIVGTVLLVLSKFNFGRKLLLKYPRFFSCGFISHEGPSEETMKKTRFNLTIVGEGWKEKQAEPTDNHADPPNKMMIVRVSGSDPGYGLTTRALLLSAITILKEANKMPGRGGVFPPGAAFAKTSLIEELDKHEMKFEVVTSKEK